MLPMAQRLLFLIVCFLALQVFAEQSSVYVCSFKDDPNGFSHVRMKRYFDTIQNRDLGKVDLMKDLLVVESTLTRVLQVPLLDNDTYIQIWHSSEIRVEAQLSHSHPINKFNAIYTKNSEKRSLFCKQMGI
jgi:hypothetical protein